MGRETFTQIDLRCNGDNFDDNLGNHHLLKPKEIEVLFKGIELEPVSEVLTQLNWDKK